METGGQAAELGSDLALVAVRSNSKTGVEVSCESDVMQRLEKSIEEVQGQDENVYASTMLRVDALSGLRWRGAGSNGQTIVEPLKGGGSELRCIVSLHSEQRKEKLLPLKLNKAYRGEKRPSGEGEDMGKDISVGHDILSGQAKVFVELHRPLEAYINSRLDVQWKLVRLRLECQRHFISNQRAHRWHWIAREQQ